MERSVQIAKGLLKIQAVFFRPDAPFTWASGIKSPVYCDNRLTLTDVSVRSDVEEGLAGLIREHYPEAEVLMGTSTAASPMPPLPAIFWACPWGMSAAAPRIMEERTKLRAGFCLDRRWWWWRI